MEVGEEGDDYVYRYTVTTRMTCIKMGSDESHLNVSLIVRDKVTRQRPQTFQCFINCERQSHKTVSTDNNF